MKGKIMFFTAFGILMILGFFTVIPEVKNVDLTDQGTFVQGEYSVSENWEDYGTLNNLETNRDTIYAEPNSEGNWTSFLQQQENFDIVELQTNSDIRDGKINYTLNLWENGIDGSADKTISGTITQANYQETIENVTEYNHFSVTLTLVEEEGSNNQRPNVDSLNVTFIENLEREGVGLDSDAFEAFVLMVFLGAIIYGLINTSDI